MSEPSNPHSDPLNMLNLWLKASGNFWSALSPAEPSKPPGSRKSAESASQKSRGRHSHMESAFNAWQTMAGAMAQPETLASLAKGPSALPEIFVQLAQSGMQHFLAMQQAMMNKGTQIGQKAQALRFETFDRDVFRLLSDLYAGELKKYLNFPQMGLTRFYQERLQRSMDTFADFQSAMAEFVHMVCLPMESALSVMQEELSAMAEADKLPEAPEEYYRMWIKTLEKHYLELFKSEDYLQVLQRTVRSSTDYVRSRKAVLLDVLQLFPVATEKDMDDVYRELYELKKRLKVLEKRKKPPEKA